MIPAWLNQQDQGKSAHSSHPPAVSGVVYNTCGRGENSSLSHLVLIDTFQDPLYLKNLCLLSNFILIYVFLGLFFSHVLQ